MAKSVRILLVTILVSLFIVTSAMAQGSSAESCPPGFMLHMAHDHDGHHGDHLIAGTLADQNGDGYICANHITPTGKVHLHIDNNVKMGVGN